VGIPPPEGAARKRILAHAEAGTTIVVEGLAEKSWWHLPGMKQLKSDPDREYFSFGKGQIIAYKEAMTDPSDVALDLIDFITQKRRTVRIWNCNTAVAMATLAPHTGPLAGAAALHIVNYGQPADLPVLARMEGNYSHATLLRAEGEIDLKVARRGTASEVSLPNLDRVASVLFR
jgi:hypothetical protein